MKFRGNKKKSHVLIYCILFISILVLVGPLYAISYNTLKDQVLKDSQAAVNRGMSRLDMEIGINFAIACLRKSQNLMQGM